MPQADIAQHIRSHISASARLFSENTSNGAQFAIWEILFAAEKAYKLWLTQRGVAVDDTHNLLALNAAVTVENASSLVEETTIKKLPSDTEAINFRYAEPNLRSSGTGVSSNFSITAGRHKSLRPGEGRVPTLGQCPRSLDSGLGGMTLTNRRLVERSRL